VSGCDNRPSSTLKGQVNTTVAFHGLTIDQDGRPLSGVRVEYEVQAYPKDWTFEKRDRPYDMSKASAVSDAAGRFTLTVTGSVIRRTVLQAPPGYRSFTEEDTGSERGRDIPSTYGYSLIHWGDLWFKSDPDNPAVYVFVKDGMKAVSALPCRGGWESGGGKKWIIHNKPAWPKRPSLKDVFYSGPATRGTEGAPTAPPGGG
jgi:hypothetical protein